MPYLSVIVPTFRPGGIDILLDALAAQTFSDFELILVDGIKRHRADRVAEYARDRFLRVVHVEPHGNPFPVASFCRYVNAGLEHATGEIVVHMVDYSRPRPDCLAKHAVFHRIQSSGRFGFMGPHRYVAIEGVEVPRYAQHDWRRFADDVDAGLLSDFMVSIGRAGDRPDEGHVVDGGGRAAADADPKLRLPPGPIAPAFFHAKNESYRLERALEVGGFDEDYDGGHGYQDTDIAERLRLSWTLDPECLVEIANPRGVFPMLQRVRSIQMQEQILQQKRAAGMPKPPRGCRREPKDLPSASLKVENWGDRAERDGSVGMVVSGGDRKLKVAMVYGEFSSAIHGPFDFARLTDTSLTGSESSFFNLARGLAERGHHVLVMAPAERMHEADGVVYMPLRPTIERLREVTECDAVLAWNEPDYLQYAPAGALRVVDQQLNDWGYCRQPPATFVDAAVWPSESSKHNSWKDESWTGSRYKGTFHVIPNSVDLDLFTGPAPERHPHRVVYSSSPDRGLHHLLAMWPAIRARVPDAELKIFYRLGPWLERAINNDDEVGRRARYVAEALRRLQHGFGVEVVGPVANREMARQLRMASILVYPCDPVRYTEGFGCSVLDAAAAGCLPIISDADAFPEVHGRASMMINGRPGEHRQLWVDEICHALQNQAIDAVRTAQMTAHATAHSHRKVAEQWERLLLSRVRK